MGVLTLFIELPVPHSSPPEESISFTNDQQSPPKSALTPPVCFPFADQAPAILFLSVLQQKTHSRKGGTPATNRSPGASKATDDERSATFDHDTKMHIDNINTPFSTICSTLRAHSTSLKNLCALTLAIFLPKTLGLPHTHRVIIVLGVTAYLFLSALKQYLSTLSPDEDDTPPPDVDTTPTLSQRSNLTMETSPAFERVRADRKVVDTKAVTWSKAQAWKQDGKTIQRQR
jgi:hypothetical protein